MHGLVNGLRTDPLSPCTRTRTLRTMSGRREHKELRHLCYMVILECRWACAPHLEASNDSCAAYGLCPRQDFFQFPSNRSKDGVVGTYHMRTLAFRVESRFYFDDNECETAWASICSTCGACKRLKGF